MPMRDAMRTAILIVIAALVGSVLGILGFIQITGGSGTPSGETTAPTLDANAIPTLSAVQAFALATRAAELEDTVAAQAAAIAAMETAATAVASQATVAAQVATAVPTEVPPTEVVSNRVLYRIAAGAESKARFFLQEDLRGVRTDVIGITDQVAGDIVIDFGAPALSQVGIIRINARTLATDNSNRNRAIRSRILRSAQDEYEFIEFAPTALLGLPESITIGESYPLEIEGQLTIVGQSLPVVFRGQVALESEERLRGEFTVTVRYADWGIAVPNLDFLANVDEEAQLTLAFAGDRVAE